MMQTRILQAGIPENKATKYRCLSHTSPDSGFTLIELIVVIALISIMLLFSMPKFQGSIIKDDTRKVSRWIIVKAELLKQDARKHRRSYIMNIDMDMRLLWISDETMEDEARDAARENGYEIPDTTRITDVEYSGGEKVIGGQAEIRFYPDGHSDKAAIHIENDDGNPCTLIIEPFLPRVSVREEYVSFEN